MMDKEEFGQHIRDLRTGKMGSGHSLTLRQFAKEVDVSPTFISKMERGHFNPPSAETIKKMAMVLHVDVDELLAFAGKIDPELEKIISQKPKAMGRLLRTVHRQGLTEEEVQAVIDYILQMRRL